MPARPERRYARLMPLQPGATGSATLVVTASHLAIAVRSGDVPVLATPMVVALCEEATVAATAGKLESGHTTVGVRVDVEHLAPSVVGATVAAHATLETVNDRSLSYRVEVSDDGSLVARGTVDRVIVDRRRFMGRLSLR